MAKYAKRDNRPIFDAIQIRWEHDRDAREGIKLTNGKWIIVDVDGTTNYCDDIWFQANYMKAE